MRYGECERALRTFEDSWVTEICGLFTIPPGRTPRGVFAMPVTKYIYDGDAILQETDGAGVPQKTYTRTGGGYGDLLNVFDETAEKYYEPDALGSTDALADQSQAVTDRWA
jgi:hypothetical protein